MSEQTTPRMEADTTANHLHEINNNNHHQMTPVAATAVAAGALTPTSAPPSGDKPNKRQKVAIACDVCRAKKVKCDSVRPICGPCSKRQHGAPCEYTTVTRTSHGPTKGYVHHLELKLRELQAGRDIDDILGRKKEPMSLTKSPQSETTTTIRPNHGAFPLHGTNWGGPGWQQQRSPEDHSRQSLSAGPPSTNGSRDHLINGSGTPDMAAERRVIEPERRVIEPERRVVEPERRVVEPERRVVEPDRRVVEPEPPAVNGRSSSIVPQVKEQPVEPANDHRVAVSRSPLVDQQTPTTAVIRKRPRSVDYILPSRKTADGLIETYWETAHALFPIIDYEAFNAAYQSIWSGSPIENESQIMCTLNILFALASSFTDTVDIHHHGQHADVFFDRAQDLFEMDLWNATGQSLESVQCLLLICQYLQSRSASRQAWVFIGLAVSMAESLFLHMTTDKVLTERQKITHQVVWHGCLYMKRILAMHDKRPSMIDPLAVTMVSKPFTRNLHAIRPEEAHFYYSLSMSEILDEILLQNHKFRTVSDTDPESQETIFTSITKIDARLFAWRNSLPQELVHPPYHRSDPRTRLVNSIRLQYWNARILLFRPIFASWCRLQSSNQDHTYSDSFTSHTSLACATLCLHSSLDNIEFIYTRLPYFEPQNASYTAPPISSPSQTQGSLDPSHPQPAGAPPAPLNAAPVVYPLPAWWDVVSYLHTSALILLAGRLNRTLCLSVPNATIQHAFETTINCLRCFAKYGGSVLAERSYRCLESLAAKTERARMDLEIEQQDQVGGRSVAGPGGRLNELDPSVKGLEWVEVGVYEL